ALDLSRESNPSQLIMAKMKRGRSLAEMLAAIGRKIEHRDRRWKPSLEETDILLIPNIHFQIEHHFTELEGRNKVFLSPRDLRGLFLRSAVQIVHFQLDRNGASVSSAARIAVGGGRPPFAFDEPFLLYMQKRGTQQPFFAMWVDNAELLQKRAKVTD